MSIVIKNTTFVENDDGKIILEKSTTTAGLNIVEVLLPDFVTENNLQQHIVSSLPFPDKIPDKYKKEFELLFIAQHLNLIHSRFFGTTGVQQQNLEMYPVEDYLFRELASNEITKDSINLMLKNEQMLVALNLIITNIKNTWSTNTIFFNLLDHLLNVLLKLHLAVNRTRNYKAYVSRKAKDKSTVVNNSSISSDRKRNLIQAEYKKERKQESMKAKVLKVIKESTILENLRNIKPFR
jgi:hypothetical protein